MALPEIRLLQAAIALAEDLNFSRAAERLHLTQPEVFTPCTDRDRRELLAIHARVAGWFHWADIFNWAEIARGRLAPAISAEHALPVQDATQRRDFGWRQSERELPSRSRIDVARHLAGNEAVQ